MSDFEAVLSEYWQKASHIETVKSHLKYFRDVARDTKNFSNKSPKTSDALEQVNDLEKYIQKQEYSLSDIDLADVPEPDFFNGFENAGQELSYPIENLPEVLRDAVEAIASHVQAPLGLASHTVLSAAKHIALSRVNAVSLFNEAMPCSLFILSLGDSGSRKSTCHRLAFKIINERERKARHAYLERKRKSSGTLGHQNFDHFDFDPQETMSDVVFEALAVHMINGCSFITIDSDDAGQWFGGHSLTSVTRLATLAGYTKAFDNGFFERNRSISNVNGSGFAYNRRLSVSLMAQDVVIRRFLLDQDFQAQGLLPRFIFSTSTSLAGTRLIAPEAPINKKITDPRILKFWERCESRLLIPSAINKKTREVEPATYFLDDDALSIWIDFYNHLEKEQADGGEYAHISAFASRGGELSRRLATVISFFDEKEHVDSLSMRGAIDIVRHSICEWSNYMLREQQLSDETLADKYVKQLSRIKLRCGSRRELQQRGIKEVRGSAATHRRLLDVLEDHKYIFSKGDGSKREYLINPHYLRSTGCG